MSSYRTSGRMSVLLTERGQPARSRPTLPTTCPVFAPGRHNFVCFTAYSAVQQTQNSHSNGGNAILRAEPPLSVVNGIHAGFRPTILRQPARSLSRVGGGERLRHQGVAGVGGVEAVAAHQGGFGPVLAGRHPRRLEVDED